MNVVVVGGGKIGLPLACAFAANGAQVTVCDIDPELVAKVNGGQSPHLEPELSDRLKAVVEQGRLAASVDTPAAVGRAEAVVIIVDAKLTAGSEIDYGNLKQASAAVAGSLQKGALVSFETTLPVGGCRGELVPILETSGLKAGRDFDVVFSPERVKSNLIFQHLEKTPKVVGGLNVASARAGEAFYRRYLGAEVMNVGTLESAEFVVLEGASNDVKCHLIREYAREAGVIRREIAVFDDGGVPILVRRGAQEKARSIDTLGVIERAAEERNVSVSKQDVRVESLPLIFREPGILDQAFR